MKKLKFKKATSDVQDRIGNLPKQYEEFQLLERAQLGTYLHCSWVERDYETAANRRFDDLDRLFGFEAESQIRKHGIETSHWANNRK